MLFAVEARPYQCVCIALLPSTPVMIRSREPFHGLLRQSTRKPHCFPEAFLNEQRQLRFTGGDPLLTFILACVLWDMKVWEDFVSRV